MPYKTFKLLRKINIYIFTFLYLVAMLRPIAPFVEYAINYDYISEVLCINKDKPEMHCNGKCYVMKQLKKQKSEDFKLLKISEEEYPIGFVEIITINSPKKINFNTKKLHFYQQNYTFVADNSVFHPPTI